jgi:cytochrome c biogenesis factor
MKLQVADFYSADPIICRCACISIFLTAEAMTIDSFHAKLTAPFHDVIYVFLLLLLLLIVVVVVVIVSSSRRRRRSSSRRIIKGTSAAVATCACQREM